MRILSQAWYVRLTLSVHRCRNDARNSILTDVETFPDESALSITQTASKLDSSNFSGSEERADATVCYIVRTFVRGCSDLYGLLTSSNASSHQLAKLKAEMDALESHVLALGVLGGCPKLSLWNRANSLVRLRLKPVHVDCDEEVVGIGQRLESAKRTYGESQPRLRSPTKPASHLDCPHDDGFYRINRLMDDLVAFSRLPNDTLSLPGLGLGSGHLHLLARRCRFDLVTVKKLDLCGNSLSDSETLCRLIDKSQCLDYVSLRSNLLSVESALDLIRLVAKRGSVFVCLDIRKNGFKLEQLRAYLLLELDHLKGEEIGPFKAALEKTQVDFKTSAIDLVNSS